MMIGFCILLFLNCSCIIALWIFTFLHHHEKKHAVFFFVHGARGAMCGGCIHFSRRVPCISCLIYLCVFTFVCFYMVFYGACPRVAFFAHKVLCTWGCVVFPCFFLFSDIFCGYLLGKRGKRESCTHVSKVPLLCPPPVVRALLNSWEVNREIGLIIS